MLDVIESLYTKDLVMVTPYDQDGDQEPVSATVYVFDKDQIARDPQMYKPLCLPSDKTMFVEVRVPGTRRSLHGDPAGGREAVLAGPRVHQDSARQGLVLRDSHTDDNLCSGHRDRTTEAGGPVQATVRALPCRGSADMESPPPAGAG